MYLVLSFPNSNTAYCQVLKHRSIQHFLNGLQHIFHYIGCVPTEIWLDNDALFCSLKKGKRKLNDLFKKAMDHYKFKAIFCSPRQGNEKGHVENHVRLLRETLFVPTPQIDSMAKYNNELLRRCDKYNSKKYLGLENKTRISILRENANSFLPLPKDKFCLVETIKVKPNEIARVAIKDKYYYLPLKYASKIMLFFNYFAVITMTKVAIYTDNKKSPIAVFDRLFEDNHHSPIGDIGAYLPYISKDLSLVFAIPFFCTLPKLIQNYYLGLSYIEKENLIKNMSLVYRKTNDIQFTYSVTLACIKENLTSRYDFMCKYKFMLLDPR